MPWSRLQRPSQCWKPAATGLYALGLIWQDQSLMAIHHFAMAADDWRRQLRHVAPEARGGDSAPATRARLQLAI